MGVSAERIGDQLNENGRASRYSLVHVVWPPNRKQTCKIRNVRAVCTDIAQRIKTSRPEDTEEENIPL